MINSQDNESELSVCMFEKEPENVKMILNSKDVFRVPLMWMMPDSKIDLYI